MDVKLAPDLHIQGWTLREIAAELGQNPSGLAFCGDH